MESNWKTKFKGDLKRFKKSTPGIREEVLGQVMRDEEEVANFGSLSASCIHHIVSYLNFDQVAQLRQVCKLFDMVGKMVLNKGHTMIRKRLKKEMEKSKENGPVPFLQSYPFHSSHFLNDINDALRKCMFTYRYYLDEEDYYFMAGKVLDKANYLLEKHKIHPTLFFVKGNLYLQELHPLLKPFITLIQKACNHFENVIVPDYLFISGWFVIRNLWPDKFQRLMCSKSISQWERMDKVCKMEKKIEKQKKTILIREQTNYQFRDAILVLNKQGMHLSQKLQEMNQKLELMANWVKSGSIKNSGLFIELNVSPYNTSWLKEPKETIGPLLGKCNRKSFKLETLPFDCLQRIFCYFSYHKVSQLRRVCKTFDKTCKKIMNLGFEKIKKEAELRNDIYNNDSVFGPIDRFKTTIAYINLFKDLKTLILYCEGTYKCYLGNKYYFSAGKVLDRFYQILILREYHKTIDFNLNYHERPHPYLFPLIALTHKAISHFQNILVPNCYPRKCSPKYIPDFWTSGHVTQVKGSFKNQILLKMEKMKNLINKQEEKMKKLNEEAEKSRRLLSKLKKIIELLEEKVLEKRKRLNECKQHCLNLCLAFNQKHSRNKILDF